MTDPPDGLLGITLTGYSGPTRARRSGDTVCRTSGSWNFRSSRVLLALLTVAIIMAPAPAAAQLDPAPRSEAPALVSSQVVVTGRVVGVRVLVVDEQGELLQIWSNTDDAAELRVCLGSLHGPPAPLTEELRAAYVAVEPSLLVGPRGLVYQRQ